MPGVFFEVEDTWIPCPGYEANDPVFRPIGFYPVILFPRYTAGPALSVHFF